jgi:tryptophan-rich sensory protein
MLSPAVLAVIICAAAAVLEGALAGKGPRQRLAQIRMPPYSPPFALWLIIGFLFYAMSLVILRHVLSTGLVSPSQLLALVLTVAVLVANAFWSLLFFRWRNLRELHRIRALCGARRRAGHRSRQDLFSRCYLAFVLLR